jgi:putative phosphoribosyl transferase
MNRKLRDGLVRITIDQYTELEGDLNVPEHSRALVVFAQGSGTSRHSPRNRSVARFLQDIGVATLLMDLLTEEEEEIDNVTRHLRFDVELLAERLVATIDWLKRDSATRNLPIGLMGASTGAAAALMAASERPEEIEAIVSQGGRPDLARESLEKVLAPTLLIVGSDDRLVIQMNNRAAERLKCFHQISVIPGGGPLFEEPGSLEKVAQRARQWFLDYLVFEKQKTIDIHTRRKTSA